MRTGGYAALSAGCTLVPYALERRALRPTDVAIEVLYCGVCYTDLHLARNDWGTSTYPMVPGHEIVGRVIALGSEANRLEIGDAVAVGCMVDSCRSCDQCRKGEEQFCRLGMTPTYNGRDRHTQETTFGGFAKHIVVRQEFVLPIPAGMDLSRTAPLLCAGITSYSPLRTWGTGPGRRVGAIGLGGIGHIAVKMAVGLGAKVTVIGRTSAKAADANRLGADAFLVAADADAMAKAQSSFDLIIDTIPVRHDISPYMPLLDIDGTLVVVGQLGPLNEPQTQPFVRGRRRLAGSLIGGIAQTQEMLQFCASENILPDCELIRIDQISDAFDRMERGDVRYRFVVDMSSLALPGSDAVEPIEL